MNKIVDGWCDGCSMGLSTMILGNNIEALQYEDVLCACKEGGITKGYLLHYVCPLDGKKKEPDEKDPST